MLALTYPRHLWWKELRQLLPLFILIPIVGALLFLFRLAAMQWMAMPLSTIQNPQQFIWIIPCLFAAGAGGIQVSQEKEHQTLYWLASLPVSHVVLVIVKLVIALAGLVLLWLIWLPLAGGLFRLAGESTYTLYDRVPIWLLYSVYILFAGSALAWRTAGPLPSLLSLTAAAVLPIALQSLQYFWLTNHHDSSIPNLLILSACILLAMFFTMLWSRRYFQVQLPGAATRFGAAGLLPNSWQLLRLDQPLMPSGIVRHAIESPPATQYSALLWQSWHQQSKWLLTLGAITCGAIALGSRFLFYQGLPHAPLGYTGIYTVTLLATITGVFLSLIWLGSLAFLSDSSGRRICFLSDRGTSPGLTWVTRQALPATVAVLAICFGATLARIDLKAVGSTECLIVLLIAGLLFGIAQWTAQVIPSVTLAFLAAPLCGLIALAYTQFCLIALGTPLSLVLVFYAIPLVATWHGMRAWMDRRYQRRFFLNHLGWLLAMLLIPVIPFAWSAITQPRLSADIRQEMLDLLKDQPYYNQKLPEITLSYKPEKSLDTFDVPLDESQEAQADESEETSTVPTEMDNQRRASDPVERQSLIAQQQEKMKHLSKQLSNASTGIDAGYQSMMISRYLHSICQLTRQSWSKQQASDESREHYQSAIRILQRLASCMRMNQKILAQDYADVVEIWLLAELHQTESIKNLGEELYVSLVQQIGDSSKRQKARQLAVARSFQLAQEDRQKNSLGGYEMNVFSQAMMFGLPQGVLYDWLFQRQRMQLAAGDLWLLAKGPPTWATADQSTSKPSLTTPTEADLLHRIAQFWDRSPATYGLADLMSSGRVHDVNESLAVLLADKNIAPALQWNAGWERQAARLLSDLPKSVQSSNDAQLQERGN